MWPMIDRISSVADTAWTQLTDVPLGLLVNGSDLRLVWAQRGEMADDLGLRDRIEFVIEEGDEGLAVAINLGMYQEDLRSNVGYARAGGHVNHRRWVSSYKSALAFGPKRRC